MRRRLLERLGKRPASGKIEVVPEPLEVVPEAPGVEDLQSVLQSMLRGAMRPASYLRSDAVMDASVEVKAQKISADIVLPNQTQYFYKSLYEPIPTTGEVVLMNIPIFASQGDGKTVTVMTLIMDLIKYYGWDKVSVHIAPHIPTLADAMRKSRDTPVKILFVDDALEHNSSRGGTSKDEQESIAKFNTLRHEFEEAMQSLNGIVFVFFTSQMYKGLEKTYREGFPVFKSALTSDKAEILGSTGMGPRAWGYLLEILRDVKIHKRKHRKSDAVVCLPGMKAGRIHIPMKTPKEIEPFLKRVEKEVRMRLEDAEGEGRDVLEARLEKILALYKTKDAAPMYKVIEEHWQIGDEALSEEEAWMGLVERMDTYAGWFVEEFNVDPGTNDGKGVIRDWLESAVRKGLPGDEKFLRFEDFVEMKKPAVMKRFYEKVSAAYQRHAKETVFKGMDLKGNPSENDIIQWAAEWLLDEFGVNPDEKGHMELIQSHLYKAPESIKKEVVRLRTAIRARVKDVWIQRKYGGVVPEGKILVKQPESGGVTFDAVVDPDAPQFMVDAEAVLDQLIDDARARHQEKRHRCLMVFKACKFLVQHHGRTLSNPTVIAEEAEGQDWQTENFGQVYSRPELNKNKSEGAGVFYNEVGLLYEEWVRERLRAGYVMQGVFDRAPIKEILHDGGNGHDPDLTVVYMDGVKDYVSLKCYTQKEPVTLSTDPSKAKKGKNNPDKIHPERFALQRDEKAGVRGNRVVVLVRNLYYDGFEGVRVFVDQRDIPTTIGFSKDDAGKWPWIRRERSRDEEE